MVQLAAKVRTSKFHVQSVVVAQNFLQDIVSKPKNLWNLFYKYKEQYPKLEEVTVCLLTMGVQTADAEHCCKVHKVIKTKACNWQVTKAVKMQMY